MARHQDGTTYANDNICQQPDQNIDEYDAYETVDVAHPSVLPALSLPRTSFSQQTDPKTASKTAVNVKWLSVAFVTTTVVFSGIFVAVFVRLPTYNCCIDTESSRNLSDVESCMELKSKYGVSTDGYYLIRTKGATTSGYRHCHFRLYEDVFTCHQLGPNLKESGHYILGTRSSPYEVFCVLPASGSATTQVWHDSMEEVQIPEQCEDEGCYSRIPQYEVDQTNIAKIIAASTSCKQYIKLRCQGIALHISGVPYRWWVSQQGQKMLYWGGSKSRKDGYCGCGDAGDCVNPSQKCNCDNNNIARITQDEGFITEKDKLPVCEMKFGDMGDANEVGWHTLGELQCVG